MPDRSDPSHPSPERHTLAEWRVIRGLTQQELAEASHVHVSTISSIEYRGQVPKADTALDIAGALGVSVEQIEWPSTRSGRRRGPRGGSDTGDSRSDMGTDSGTSGDDPGASGSGARPKLSARAAA